MSATLTNPIKKSQEERNFTRIVRGSIIRVGIKGTRKGDKI